MGPALWLSLAAVSATEVTGVFADDLEHLQVESRISLVSSGTITIVFGADRYRAQPAPLSPSGARELFAGAFDAAFFDGVWIEVDGHPCDVASSSRPGPHGERLVTCAAAVRRPVDGGTCDGASVSGPRGERLVSCAAAVGAVTVVARARLHVPDRYGPFGRRGRHVTLGADWYPYALGDPAAARVTISAPGDLGVLIGGRWFPADAAPRARTVQADLQGRGPVALVLRSSSVRGLPIAGGRARFLTGPVHGFARGFGGGPGAAFGGGTARGFAGGSEDSDVPREVREVGEAILDGLRFLHEEGVPIPDRSRPLVVAHAPLRHDLAQRAGGVVLVSDRAFRLPPFDRFLRFHRFPILREVFAEVLARRVEDDPLAADALASWLLDRYVAVRFGRAENAFDILGPFDFVPSIDSMLFAPDLPFVGAYFRVIREDDPLRPELLDGTRDRPRGKVIYEKLADRIGGEAVSRAFARVLRGEVSFLSAVGAAAGDPAFLATWLGPYPDVRYRLAGWSSTATSASAVIARDGAVVAEPIEVRFTSDDGEERVVTAPASPAPIRTVTTTLAAPLDLVEIDPRGRLAETPTDGDPSPRFDNRSRPSWKVLLNNFAILISASRGTIDTALDLGLARRHDVHWRFRLRAEAAEDAYAVGGQAAYSFGGRVNAAELAQTVGLGVSADYLRPGFAEETAKGLALRPSVFWLYDDRTAFWAPEDGQAVSVRAELNHFFGDTAGDITADALAVTVRGVKQWRLGLAHQLAVRLSAGAYLVGQPRRQLLYSVGGRYGARGYAVDAALGRVRGLASAEWLHTLVPEVNVNLAWLGWITGIDGALYGDVATIAEGLDRLGDAPLLGDIGYGIRLYLDYGGVRPGVMAIDFALPLAAPRGEPTPGPPAVYIDFSQSFFLF